MNTIKFKTSTGEELSVNLSETTGSGKGKRFLPQSSGFDPLTVARTESDFMLRLLENAAGVVLNAEQKEVFFTALSDLPEGATVLDLLDSILGIEPEQYKPLAPLFKVLQQMQEEGVHAGLFVKATGSAFDSMKQAELSAWYMENIGYDPIKEDPLMSLEVLRSKCKEHALIDLCGGLDTVAYQEIEAQRRIADKD